MQNIGIKRIPFFLEYKINKIKCEDFVIYLSDFIYKSSNGNEYYMVVYPKGCEGDWHVMKSSSENKLYATDNLWYGSHNKNTDIQIIDERISYSELTKKYNDKNINYINSLDYVDDCDIKKIKIKCKESITTYFKEQIKIDFKYKHLITHISSTDDCDMCTLKIISYPESIDTNGRIYEVCSNTHSEYFRNIYDAQTCYLEWLFSTLNNKYNNYKSCCFFTKSNDIDSLYMFLITVDIKYLNKNLLEEAYKYNIIFTKCKQLKYYNASNNNIYIIKTEWIKQMKELYNCDFIDYNLLNARCNKSKGETMCMLIMEELYPSYIFEKIRPMWLLNVGTNRPLELDIYNDILKIAIEYNGIQHYEYCPFFHNCENDFEKQQQRDLLKHRLCVKNGIKLINIHYSLNNYDKIKEYIKKELINNNVEYKKLIIEIKTFFKLNFNKNDKLTKFINKNKKLFI